jgi:thymidylate synthase ThyX
MIKKTRASGGTVFLFDDLNPEDGAMCQALLTRDAAGVEPSLKKVYAARREAFAAEIHQWIPETCNAALLDALMAVAGHNDASAPARRVNKTYTVGFGHKSIADCGSSTLVFEGISMLAAKAIEDWALYSGEELSTRACDMAKQSMIDPIGTPESKAILDRWIRFYVEAQEPTAAEVRRRYPRKADEDEKTYENAVKYRVFDILRAFLPAASTTNVSLHMNLRQHGDKMPWLLHHPLAEVQDMGVTAQSLLCERYPSSGTFGGGAAVSGVGVDGKEDERLTWNRAVVHEYTYPSSVTPGFRHTIGMLAERPVRYREATDTRPRGCMLPHFMSDLGQVQFGFDIDFGSFRDIQRHRNGVCRMPLLTPGRFFEGWYLDQLDVVMREKAVKLLCMQEEAISKLDVGRDPHNPYLQYYVAMGYKVPCSVTMGLPAFLYMAELRSTKVVHPTLRAKVLWMVDQFQQVFPNIKMHIDRDPDGWDVRRGTQTITEKAK